MTRMTQYWLLTMTEDNYHVIRRHRVYGAPASTRRDVTDLIRPGDVIIFYIAKKASRTLGGRIAAAYRVAGEWYTDEELL